MHPRHSLLIGALALPAAIALPAFLQAFDASDITPESVPSDLFVAKGDLEVTVWAESPLFFNPTNMDIDRYGNVWVAEGVRYRRNHERQPDGDRIMVVKDTDGDGKADESHVFVQEEALVAPLGVSVIDNKVVVAQPPELIVYTDVNRDMKFDPAVDEREVILTGFMGKNHDHSLHSVTVGPDGKWYWNAGNCGARFEDADGKWWNVFGAYRPKPIGPWEYPWDASEWAGKPSDDGHTYVGGFTVRMNPDATDVEIIGHNYRNSYEQSVNSFGDVFQNDNDDPPACRVSYVMEYANFGFSSLDGQRSWRADQRPGQSVATAEWRQDDPGSYPAGDVYGGGSPTGNVYYENGALGEDFEGMFLACEAGRNVVFGYLPRLEGAGFSLDRFDFLTSNAAGEFAGSDFLGGSDSVNNEQKTLFRPSDVAVGPDGALYVTDWYDARVGGHQDLDETCSGTIYRIAPKGFKSVVPDFDEATIEGAITALSSPAVNVRAIGHSALVGFGEEAVPALVKLMDHESPYVAARAVWILPNLGDAGLKKTVALLEDEEPRTRIAAFRALRRVDHEVLKHAATLAADKDPAVRRDAALALRDVPFVEAGEILQTVAAGYDGEDRYYLEALGTGATNKEAELYATIVEEAGDPIQWSDAFAGIAWRLHPEAAIDAFRSRALDNSLTMGQRQQSLDALAFINEQQAADAVVELATLDSTDALSGDAKWWLLNRANNHWTEFGIMDVLKERGIYDPAKVQVVAAVIPPAPAESNLPPIEEIAAMKGDPVRGESVFARCMMCHQVDGKGVVYGPALDGWARTQTTEVLLNSLIHPSSDIAHGFGGTEIIMKDGTRVQGLLINSGNPRMIRSMGGITQTIPAGRIDKQRKMDRSLMMSAEQLGMTAQDLADIAAWLKQK